MPRIRWSEPDTPKPLDWRGAGFLTATIFTNFYFWFFFAGNQIPPLPLSAPAVILGCLTLAAVFLAGPALLCAKPRRTLSETLEASLGRIPAWIVRVSCVTFAALTISQLAWFTTWLLSLSGSHEFTRPRVTLLAAALIFFLFLTVLQPLTAAARQARFTIHLSIAVLIAGAIRVRDGWPDAFEAVPYSRPWTVPDFLHGDWTIVFFLAPLAFLAADSVARVETTRGILKTAALGLALPLIATLLILTLIESTTWRSQYYTPSLPPNIAMALWGKTSRPAMIVPAMAAAITMFGVLRLCLRTILSMTALPSAPRFVHPLIIASAIACAAWIAGFGYGANIGTPLEISVELLTLAAATLTADAITGFRRESPAPWIDWPATLSISSGLAVFAFISWYEPELTWSLPALLPSYATTLIIALAARTLAKPRRSRRGEPPINPQPSPQEGD